ncbi:MAG: thioredoxin domain-containing protein [Chloroflexi bacterium]|nr:thioredoxin domain-containing protein [Chloroflexota bacterium]
MDRLADELGSQVKVVYRHFPLPNHPQAGPAAEAAEAAGEQGKFWPMVNALYANQKELGPALYVRLARELGLNVAAFSASMEGHTNLARIQADLAEARKQGIPGTPTFVLNGQRLPGVPGSYETLERVVRAALGAAR